MFLKYIAGLSSNTIVTLEVSLFMTLLIKQNKILILCAIALSLDPLFCYMLLVHGEKKCLGLDRTLRTIAIVSRSAIDFLYMLHIIFQFCATRSINPVDILVILPLHRVLLDCKLSVLVFAIIPELNNLRVLKATESLNFIFIFQYVPRFLQICSWLKKDLGSSSILAKSTWANLFFFMLASILFALKVIGAFWYLFSVERKATCWLKACSHVGVHCSLYCNDAHRASIILNDYCSKNSRCGVVDSADIVQRISYCFWWGLQNLSSLGQGLKTSTYVWEIYFSTFISISGLLSFAFLIGNVQAYLLSEVAGSEERRVRVKEMRLKRREMESWRPSLSSLRILESGFCKPLNANYKKIY
ncbi:putative Ion transport domain-containing protein [Rosa chinensis]|uniref:Putative Ion transport domain-containing protein n=1 Tax=Rosa chinensis TaxID=74649 RepID=A0A2P6RNZ3_ROSCH|nr:putative Ion transport domain-containing protein [Rosa chinensis]